MNETVRRQCRYFEMFSRDFPLPKGTIEHRDKLDVILHGERVIGIEMTNFYLEPGGSSASEQQQRKMRTAVVSEAQRLFQQSGNKNAAFIFGFDKNHPIDNGNALARRIATLAEVLSHEPPDGEISPNRYRQQIRELSFWYRSRTTNEGVPWQVCQVHKTPIMSIARLKSIVATKEAKSNGYQPCGAFWLLVIVDFFDRAQDQELSNGERLTSTVFEKIIVYKTAFGTYVEMQKG